MYTRDTSLGDQRNQPAICRVSPCPYWSLIFPVHDWNCQLLSLTGIHIISVKVGIEAGFNLSKILHQCFPGRTQTAYLTSSTWLFAQTLIEPYQVPVVVPCPQCLLLCTHSAALVPLKCHLTQKGAKVRFFSFSECLLLTCNTGFGKRITKGCELRVRSQILPGIWA